MESGLGTNKDNSISYLGWPRNTVREKTTRVRLQSLRGVFLPLKGAHCFDEVRSCGSSTKIGSAPARLAMCTGKGTALRACLTPDREQRAELLQPLQCNWRGLLWCCYFSMSIDSKEYAFPPCPRVAHEPPSKESPPSNRLLLALGTC